MPRKYRPPESRRRKARTVSPHIYEQLPSDGDTPLDGAGAATLAEEVRASAPAIAERTASARSRATATKHISRDYGYVRGEIRRILLVAGFLIVSLMITALLRN